MSPIGRIFTVLNLILAAAFLGWASNALATGNDWKSQHDSKVAEMDQASAMMEDEMSELRTTNSTLAEGERQARERRDQLQAEVEDLKTQLGAATRRSDGLEGDVTQIQATLADYNGTIDRLSGEKDRANELIRELERGKDEAMDTTQAAEMGRRDAEEALNAANARLSDLESEREALTAQVEALQTRVDALLRMTGGVEGN